MQTKQNIMDVNPEIFRGKRVLVRVDFNVPLKDGIITDDTRIKSSLPTIEYLVKNGARVILVSHLGRPKGIDKNLTLLPIAKQLHKLTNQEIHFMAEPISENTMSTINALPNGSICMLENIRFYPEEEKNDLDFANFLAKLADIYVNDAFGTSHRAHASTAGITQKIKIALAGDLVDQELKALNTCLKNPSRPFAVIIGGSKVSTKISLLDNLINNVDLLIIGGAMAFTFLKAQGHNIGKSLVENDYLDYCRNLLNKACAQNVKILLPQDVIAASSIKDGKNAICLDINSITDDLMGLDIGKLSQSEIRTALQSCKTIFWNGPLGVFEEPGFESGTFTTIDTLVELTKTGVKTIVGGGDSLAALKAKNIDFKTLTHVATGGGATLEYLEGKSLPGIDCLNNHEPKAQVSLA